MAVRRASMQFILVPHQVTDTTATIWVGAIDVEEDVRQSSVSIEVDDGSENSITELDASRWKRWQSYSPGDEDSYQFLDRFLDWILAIKPSPIIKTLDFQRLDLDALNPRTSYSLKLRVDDQPAVDPDRQLREARVTTLPAKLPNKGEKPFTVFLGSCFYKPEDEEGMVGKTYHSLPEERRPDIKVLCGDQVYLDNPWWETTLKYNGGNLRRGLFRAMLFQKYIDNWTQIEGEDAGFRQLLKDGANYFCSDDHEFWNNAPNFGGVGFINTLSPGQRKWWLGEARRLFRAFQSPSPLLSVEVPPLSFRIVDTRIYRDTKGRCFMKDKDLRAVGRWIEGLRGPGVLVVGQPVLIGEARGPRSLVADLNRTFWSALDRNLADYGQYEELVGYIKASAHSIVVLSGDVHFGRIACVRPQPDLPDAEFVEVIASPMQLVKVKSRLLQRATKAFGSYKAAPTHHLAITENQQLAPEHSHFATVEFSQAREGKVELAVWSWPIPESTDNISPNPDCVFEAVLS
jgi:hypothetical protein